MRFPKALTASPALFKALLEQFPHPTLLVDSRDRVVAANLLFLRLTAYASNEIPSLSLSRLFPTDIDGGGHVLLQDRYGRHHAVVLDIIPLEEGYRLIICQTQARVNAETRRQTLIEDLLEGWGHLLALVASPPISYTLDQALEVWRSICAARWIAFYRPEPPMLRLHAKVGETPSLPSWLPLSEILNLPEAPTLWPPGKRIGNETLHHLFTSTQRHILYTVPLFENHTLLAWVVLGFTLPPNTHVPHLLELLAQFFVAWFVRHRTLEQLHEQMLQVDSLAALGKALYKDTPYPIVLLNAEGQVVGLNEKATSVLGYTEREVLFWPVDHIVVTDAPIQHYLNILYTQERPQLLDDTTVYRRTGHPFPARLYFVPVLPKYNLAASIRAALIVYDLSNEQIMESLRRRAEIGTLLANFAHEIRNPLNNLSTGLEWLKMSLASDNPLQDTLHRMGTDLDRLTEMTTHLLDYTRPREYRFHPLQLDHLLTRLLERQRPRLNKYGITTELESEGPLPPIRGDEVALEQVFINLINNAVDALKSVEGDRLIAIRLRNVENGVEVAVADNGPGIPENLRSRIFEPFFTTRSEGHGLGLAITRAIVTAHRGSISVESFPGGTIFRVVLPRAESPAKEST